MIFTRPRSPASPAARAGRGRRAIAVGAACLAGALFAGAARAGDPAAVPAARTAPVQIALRPAVEVAEPEVTLGDVAVLEAHDLPTLKRLAAIPLGAAPRADRPARLERGALLRWIRARTGIGEEEVSWSGADACDVRLAVRDLPGETIALRAVESVRAQLSRDGRRVDVGVREPPRDVTIPLGQVRLDVRPLAPTAVVPRRLSAWVDVSVDGRFVRTVPVGLDVAVFAPALVATRDHAPGQLLDRTSVAVREVEWSGLDALPVQPDVPEPLRLRRPIAAGETVTRARVEAAPLVARGQWATLRASAGLVQVESRVQVLQDGRSGDTVRVVRPDGRAAIQARVTGPGVVVLQ